MKDSKLYIAVLDEFPDYMVPTLVAHTMLAAHLKFEDNTKYKRWLESSFKKCVVKVNQKEFDKILGLSEYCLGCEKNTLNGKVTCIIPLPYLDIDRPNVLKFAKLWKPHKQ